jgi:hypothetical protein
VTALIRTLLRACLEPAESEWVAGARAELESASESEYSRVLIPSSGTRSGHTVWATCFQLSFAASVWRCIEIRRSRTRPGCIGSRTFFMRSRSAV